MWRVQLCVVACYVAHLQALKLPDYIKPCARTDPKFNECAKKSAIEAIPKFINGDPKYKVPPLDPMLISQLEVNEGTSNVGLTLRAVNATMSGLKDVEVKDVRIDFKKQLCEYDWYFPKLQIDCMYNVSGRILLLPIFGHGPGTITLKKVFAKYSYDFAIEKKKGIEYFIPKKSNLIFDPKGLSIHLENLFNGDKFLGSNLNRFINENWQEILNDVGPPIADAMSQFIQQVLINIFTLVPYDEAVPEKL